MKKSSRKSASTSSSIIELTAEEITSGLRRKKFSCVEATRAFIARVEAVNPSLNAVVAFYPEEALKTAKRHDANFKKFSQTPLFGVPATIKDSFDVKGMLSTAGIVARKDFVPTEDATVVRRLRDAGVILLGKTNTPEITMSFQTNNLLHGESEHPTDPTRSPGGSSGGAAAIVAAKGAAFDIGSDTGGSIRWPAHSCGVFGLKPTQGRVPRTGHIIDYRFANESLTHVGPIAHSIGDLEKILSVIQGPDLKDPFIAPVPLSQSKKVSVYDLRVGYFEDNGLQTPDAEILGVLREALKKLTWKKRAPKKTQLKKLAETSLRYNDLVSHGDYLARAIEQYGPGETSLPWIHSLPNTPVSEYLMGVEKVNEYRSSLLEVWQEIDVLLCPVAPTTAVPLGASYPLGPFHSYTSAFNITGWPSLSVPMGVSKEGLPIGVQIVAPPWRDDIALAVGRYLADAIADS